jgi:hypothetical protein
LTAARDHLAAYTGRDPLNVALLARSGDVDGATRMLKSPAFQDNIHRRALAGEIAFMSSRRTDSTVVNDLNWVVSTIHRAGARRYLHSETLADVLVLRGETEAAIRVLKEAHSGMSAAYNPAAHTGYYWLRAQMKLADLYRAHGMTEQARPIEADLLALLSHADADHPMLVELTKRN